ncbi:hypothetical protein PMAYCL1PPCAC_02406, partial [Pristionchus mayeri]
LRSSLRSRLHHLYCCQLRRSIQCPTNWRNVHDHRWRRLSQMRMPEGTHVSQGEVRVDESPPPSPFPSSLSEHDLYTINHTGE